MWFHFITDIDNLVTARGGTHEAFRIVSISIPYASYPNTEAILQTVATL